jgi:hypothetical protein
VTCKFLRRDSGDRENARRTRMPYQKTIQKLWKGEKKSLGNYKQKNVCWIEGLLLIGLVQASFFTFPQKRSVLPLAMGAVMTAVAEKDRLASDRVLKDRAFTALLDDQSSSKRSPLDLGVGHGTKGVC